MDDDIRWLGEARVGRVTHARIGACGDQLIAEWASVGKLTVGRDGSNPMFETLPGVHPLQRSKIEQGAVRLLLRSLNGKIGLHGSAVEIGGRAIVFIGDARDGKSTLAAALCTDPNVRLLADDAVALEGPDPWSVEPTEHAHFLDALAIQALDLIAPTETLRGKGAVEPSRVCDAPSPLQAIVRLRFDDQAATPRLVQVSMVEALASIIPQTIRFALDEPARQRVEVDKLCDLAAHVPTFELVRARRMDELSRCVALICEVSNQVLRP